MGDFFISRNTIHATKITTPNQQRTTMADEIDQADINTARFMDRHVAAIRQEAAKKAPVIQYQYCRNQCGAKTENGQPYCCDDCKEDFEYRQKVAEKQRAR
jgi:hypothetical protein